MWIIHLPRLRCTIANNIYCFPYIRCSSVFIIILQDEILEILSYIQMKLDHFCPKKLRQLYCGQQIPSKYDACLLFWSNSKEEPGFSINASTYNVVIFVGVSLAYSIFSEIKQVIIEGKFCVKIHCCMIIEDFFVFMQNLFSCFGQHRWFSCPFFVTEVDKVVFTYNCWIKN